MADTRRGGHGVGRFFEEGAYSLGWAAFMGGTHMFGNAVRQWFENEGAQMATEAARKEAEEHGHGEAWDIILKLEDPCSTFIQEVRDYVIADPERPAGEHRFKTQVGQMYVVLINGYADADQIEKTVHDKEYEVPSSNAQVAASQRRVVREITTKSSSKGEGLELFQESLRILVKESQKVEGEKEDQYERFLSLLKGYSTSAWEAMFKSAAFWASKLVQRLIPNELRDADKRSKLVATIDKEGASAIRGLNNLLFGRYRK